MCVCAEGANWHGKAVEKVFFPPQFPPQPHQPPSYFNPFQKESGIPYPVVSLAVCLCGNGSEFLETNTPGPLYTGAMPFSLHYLESRCHPLQPSAATARTIYGTFWLAPQCTSSVVTLGLSQGHAEPTLPSGIGLGIGLVLTTNHMWLFGN